MLCGIIAKTANGWIICLNVNVCYKLITLLIFSSLPAKAQLKRYDIVTYTGALYINTDYN